MNTQEFAESIDWDALEQDAASGAAAGKDGQKSVFMKMKAGIHKTRIIPSGNPLQRLPYLTIKQHQLEITNMEGQKNVTFVVCWNFIWNNLTLQKSDEDRSTKSILGYLIKNQIMNKDIDFPKYNQHKCPICKFFEHLDLLGAAKEIKNKFYAREQNFFNVLWRQTDSSGDGEVYVWNIGKQHFNSIIGFARTCYKDMQLNIFDVNSGFDMRIHATGEGMGRRYTIDFMPAPLPLNLGEKTPYNLIDVMAKSYKPYQEVVDLLKQSANKLIAESTFKIAGDENANILSPSVQNKVQNPNNITIMKDNVLYNADGKELF